jgi:hypothetical protein
MSVELTARPAERHELVGPVLVRVIVIVDWVVADLRAGPDRCPDRVASSSPAQGRTR